jgi:hypothetical protein
MMCFVLKIGVGKGLLRPVLLFPDQYPFQQDRWDGSEDWNRNI